MEDFATQVKEVQEVKEHPNADKLELTIVDGKQVCTGIGEFKKGDLVAFIEPDTLVPQEIQEELGVSKYLNNKKEKMGRVRQPTLRGQKSEGLLYPAKEDWEKGQDVSDELGTEKYIPPVPVQMRGQIHGGHPNCTLEYNVNNYRRHMDVFDEGDPVIVMEKIHGTLAMIGVLPESMAIDHFDEEYNTLAVASNTPASKGQLFIPNAEENKDNVYLRTAKHYEIDDKLQDKANELGEPIFVMGEIFGEGIQEIHYGKTVKRSDEEIGFRIFDIYKGLPGEGNFLEHDNMRSYCHEILDVPPVPTLYKGPFKKEVVASFRGGLEQVSGEERHIREGIVIRHQDEEERHPKLPRGRKQLKAKAYDYLLMHGSDVGEKHFRSYMIKIRDQWLIYVSPLRTSSNKEDGSLFKKSSFENVRDTLTGLYPFEKEEIQKENVKVVTKKSNRLKTGDE